MDWKLGGLILLLAAPAWAQQTISGPPTADDFEFFCKAYRSAPDLRADCEASLKLSRGVLECDARMWEVGCRADGMTDETTCTVRNRHAKDALLVVATKGRASFMLVGDKYPGEPMAVRVDQHSPIRFDEVLRGAQAAKFQQQLRSGETVQTRFVSWPYGTNTDRKMPVCDLPAKIDDAIARSR